MYDEDDTDVDVERRATQKHSKKKLSFKERLRILLDSPAVTSLLTIITIYALYSDDFRVLFFQKSSDSTFFFLTVTAFLLFLVEIIAQCWCMENYMKLPDLNRMKSAKEKLTKYEQIKVIVLSLQIGSFYFWLDLMATCSMIFDVLPTSIDDTDSSFTSANSARAGKASKAGSKAARMIKVVRMIRLVRLVKLYKYFSEKKNKKDGTIIPTEIIDNLDDIPPESHVGAEMSDRTTKKVILGCLIMLIVIPLLQVTDVEYLNEFGMQMVFERRENLSSKIKKKALTPELEKASKSWTFVESQFLQSTTCIQVTYLKFNDSISSESTIPLGRAHPIDLRTIEKNKITISNENDTHRMSAIFDISQRAREESLLATLLTTFVIILLAAGTLTFSRDVNALVIIPIEKMVQLVREISANPLGKNYTLMPEDIKKMDDGLETTLLLRTISKIAGLMRVGFGEAGAEIIGKNLNMTNDNPSDNTMNLLGNGTKILSIFGFCDIRNFTDTTECLQEEVMLFVNRIAHILHSIVVQSGGAANKNIGDAFLLTWKIDSANTEKCEDHHFSGDKALYALLKTMIEMNKHEDFICNFSPSALGALYDRIPGYRCRMGCGLHFGWAVEGAIGSDKKIDASYISPHVNWAEFLESSTKFYEVPILMSGPFHKLLSPEAKKYCRQVDRVKKSINEDVIDIYTYDADLDHNLDASDDNSSEGRLHAESSLTNLDLNLSLQGLNSNLHKKKHNSIMVKNQNRRRTAPQLTRQRKTLTIKSQDLMLKTKSTGNVLSHKKKNHHVNRKQSTSVSSENGDPDIIIPTFSTDVWETDEDLVRIRAGFTNKHREIWQKAISAYIEGDWSNSIVCANKMLEITSQSDGPSKRLLAVIESHNFTVPGNWAGYRSLEE